MAGNGHSEVKTSTREFLYGVIKVARNNVTARKNYDVVAKELFFAEDAMLVEGSDDVNYIADYLEASNQDPPPMMGYGCGGAEAIRPWMRLCDELGIRCAALYDGDKSEEFEAALKEFASNDSVQAFLLTRPDIRDKYERDRQGKETKTLRTKGVFQRDGAIHDDAMAEFEKLILKVRVFLHAN